MEGGNNGGGEHRCLDQRNFSFPKPGEALAEKLGRCKLNFSRGQKGRKAP